MSRQLVHLIPHEALKKTFESIDVVFLDIDGVVSLTQTPIPLADKCVAKFRQLNKKIGFVTNNVFDSLDVLRRSLIHCEASLDEINTPNELFISQLKSRNISGDVFMIGSSLVRNLLIEAGFKVIECKDVKGESTVENFTDLLNLLKKAERVCKNVEAIIVSVDFNYTHQSAQIATHLLQRNPNILFFTGTSDDTAPLSHQYMCVGFKYVIDGIQRWSNKSCIEMAKPSKEFGDALVAKYGISDASRVLFIGDHLTSDISFARKCQFKTLLVLSGITTRSEVDDPTLPDSHRPDFVADSLAEVFNRIKDF